MAHNVYKKKKDYHKKDGDFKLKKQKRQEKNKNSWKYDY